MSKKFPFKPLAKDGQSDDFMSLFRQLLYFETGYEAITGRKLYDERAFDRRRIMLPAETIRLHSRDYPGKMPEDTWLVMDFSDKNEHKHSIGWPTGKHLSHPVITLSFGRDEEQPWQTATYCYDYTHMPVVGNSSDASRLIRPLKLRQWQDSIDDGRYFVRICQQAKELGQLYRKLHNLQMSGLGFMEGDRLVGVALR